MTSKSCFVCDKFHSSQFPDELLTCDKHTYLTVSQVCDYLKVRRETIARWQSKGRLTRYVLGKGDDPSKGHARYTLSEIKEFITKTEAK